MEEKWLYRRLSHFYFDILTQTIHTQKHILYTWLIATTRGNNGKRKPLTIILTFLTCAFCVYTEWLRWQQSTPFIFHLFEFGLSEFFRLHLPFNLLTCMFSNFISIFIIDFQTFSTVLGWKIGLSSYYLRSKQVGIKTLQATIIGTIFTK